ncbi:MAG: ABC transporter substrate-binding protein, partial [Syntrophobacteraceae bacterium]
MRKLAVFSGLVLLVALTLATPVRSADTIRIGFNIPLTGDAPKVGECSKYAAEIRIAEINGAGGLRVGDKSYRLEFIYIDNESKAESAIAVALKLITQDQVLGIIGPQASKQ